MPVAYETSFTMRRATGLTLQPHQNCTCHAKMTLMSDPRHRWNVIYNARSNRHRPPTSPNTAPAPQNCTPKSKRNLPKTVEASFTMRGRFDHDPNMIRAWNCKTEPVPSQSLFFLPPQRILHFALRLSTQISPNTAPATKSGTPRSPNTAPATQNDSHEWCPSHMKGHLQCAEQQDSSSNVTKNCTCHAKWLSWMMSVTYEMSFAMRRATGITLQPHQILRLPRKIAVENLQEMRRIQLECHLGCATDPNPIRPWSEQELVISHSPVRRGDFSRFGDAFCIENYNISRSGYLLRFQRILRLPQKVTLQDHQILRLPRKVTPQDHQILHLPRKVTLQDDQILRLPGKVTLLLYWAVTLLRCYFIELLLDWTVTLLSCYFTELLLHWTVTLLSCYFTELLLCWAVTLLSCYFIELWLY